MKKKIILLILSISVVITILASSSYAVLFKENETDEQVYTTGMLEITSEATNDSVTLSNSLPMSDTDGLALTPYTFKITNTGNLTYKFDVKLLATNTTNLISSDYIKVSVNGSGAKKLSDFTDGILFADQTLLPGGSLDVTLRVWLDEYTPNTELGKTFAGKITTEGQAIYTESPSLQTLKRLGLDDSLNETKLTTISSSSSADGTTGIYETEDDLGTSYYFRGNVTNNYVYFAGFYWRIIRINGDGTVRMIYDGTSAHANNEASADRQIGTSAYNTVYKDNAFVGYMNGTTDGTNFPSGGTNSTSYEEAHSNTTDSTVKTYVDNWYKTNIVDTNFSSYVADAIYCNDRTTSSGTGIGLAVTTYAAYDRIFNLKQPTLKCTQINDRFTVRASLGNGKLSYPVGLISADELVFGGQYVDSTTNTETYLYNGTNRYITMSPYQITSTPLSLIFQSYNGYGGYNIVYNSSNGIRPVISLKADAIKSGNGTASYPFRVDEPSLTTLTNLGLTSSVKETELTTFTTTSELDGTTGIYAAEDDLGTSYYFRGNITNNYVKFANFYWRIVRINGDGSIRMIYDGTSAHANGESSTDRQISTSAFNSILNNDNTYVGYMYGTAGASDYATTHSNTTDSTIKKAVENWYKTNIVDTGYSGSVVDAIYCNDRTVLTDDVKYQIWFEDETKTSGNGIGTSDTMYGTWARLEFGDNYYNLSEATPTLKCSQVNDRFTTGAMVGNGDLTYPVGLITADEAIFAGGYGESNSSYYLYSGQHYWTMTSSFSIGGSAYVFFVYSDGLATLGEIVDNSALGVRPVITLSSSAITGGTGIATDPFVTLVSVPVS